MEEDLDFYSSEYITRMRKGERLDMVDPAYIEAYNIIDYNWKKSTEYSFVPYNIAELRVTFKSIFDVELPKNTAIMQPFTIDFVKHMQLGENVFINRNCLIMAGGGIIIEDGVQIAPNVTLTTTNHDFEKKSIVYHQTITLKKNCWIGANAIILPNITVGEGAIVAAGAIVTKNVEPWTIVAGNPAKVIRKIKE